MAAHGNAACPLLSRATTWSRKGLDVLMPFTSFPQMSLTLYSLSWYLNLIWLFSQLSCAALASVKMFSKLGRLTVLSPTSCCSSHPSFACASPQRPAQVAAAEAASPARFSAFFAIASGEGAASPMAVDLEVIGQES